MDASLQVHLDGLRKSLTISDGSQLVALRALEELRRAVTSTTDNMESDSSNHYFDIPQRVSSIFTGRESHLRELQELFVPRRAATSHDQLQRRFVIHGLGGSGKTQFCCKFAQDNQESFWAIFWIDASTEERAKQTLGDIVETAGLDKDENAALLWLSNLRKRWLLIIDNADNDDVPLDKYFPKGKRGNILVTTRNPAYRLHGNVGRQYYTFQGLQSEDATQLLLKAANISHSCWKDYLEEARVITKELGFLALAIVHAGAAIADNMCDLEHYLDYYGRMRRRIRNSKLAEQGSDNEATVFATWEICHARLRDRALDDRSPQRKQAAVDALELLNVLAFFHWEAISFQIFTRAAKNLHPVFGQTAAPSSSTVAQKPPWGKWLREIPSTLVAFILKNRTPSILPRVIADIQSLDTVGDAQDRIRSALKELIRMSLIMGNEHGDTYSMHPIVHMWARERPGMKAPEQALWADVAGRVLASSVLLPPLDSSATDERYHISLFPHVEFVQNYRGLVSKEMATTSIYKKHAWSSLAWIKPFVPPLAPDAEKMLMYTKFSLVYAKCGHFAKAKRLMKEVSAFLDRYLGPHHERSRKATLFLSTLYWNLGRTPDAKRLQQSLLQTCSTRLGPTHPETIEVMGEVGLSLWLQGQYTAARALQEKVLKELLKRLPPDHKDVLQAMDHLGITVHKFWGQDNFERALQLHTEAAAGMTKVLGPDHEKTLIARENASRVGLLVGGEHVKAALITMEDVLQRRRERLGDEHPYTLMAMANLGLALTANGRLDEADRIFVNGLPVGERILGSKAISFQFGRHSYACTLAQQGRYAEAEELLVQVTECQKYVHARRGDYHPDRLGALIELARCCYIQGKIARSIAICDEVIFGLDKISTMPHPLAQELRVARSHMLELKEGGVDGDRSEVKFPFVVFRYRDGGACKTR